MNIKKMDILTGSAATVAVATKRISHPRGNRKLPATSLSTEVRTYKKGSSSVCLSGV